LSESAEVGVTGGDDPYNRATYPWAGLGGAPDTALLASFKQLIALLHQHPVLRRGSLDAPLFADANVLVLARRLGNTWALVALNNAATARTVLLALPEGLPAATLRDVLEVGAGAGTAAAAAGMNAEVWAGTGAVAAVMVKPALVDGRLQLEVPPLFGRVLITR